MAPGQEWHADSWSIPYFSSCRSKRMLAIKRCKHFELGGDNKRKGQVIQFWALGFFCSYVSRGKCWSYRKIAWMRINTVISLLKKKKILFVNIKVFLKAWWLFNHKKEWSTDIFYNMDESWKHCVKWKKPDTKGYIFYDPNYMKDTE